MGARLVRRRGLWRGPYLIFGLSLAKETVSAKHHDVPLRAYLCHSRYPAVKIDLPVQVAVSQIKSQAKPWEGFMNFLRWFLVLGSANLQMMQRRLLTTMRPI